MGMLFSKPKYTPPPELEESKKAVAEREASAEAAERKELRALAGRRAVRKRDPRELLGSSGLLGIVDETPQPPQPYIRDPLQTGKMR